MTIKLNTNNHSFLDTIRSHFSPQKKATSSLGKIPTDVQNTINQFLSPTDRAVALGVQRSWNNNLSSDKNKHFLPKEKNLSLTYYEYDDESFGHAIQAGKANHKKLVSLEMPSQMRITNSGLQHLVRLPLRKLDLTHTHNLSNDGLKYLTKLPLKELYLKECSITDGGLKHIARISSLRTLDLSNCNLKAYAPFSTELSAMLTLSDSITDAGLKRLTHLSLEELRLSACRITDEGLRHLPRTLTTLDLSDCNITDEDLRHLAQLTSLKHLNLKGCRNFTPKGLSYLANLPCLTHLDLRGINKFTDQDIVCLQGLRRAKYFFGAEQRILECNLDKGTSFQGSNHEDLYHMMASYLIPDSLQVQR